MTSENWTFLFANPLTQTYLCELPINSAKFTSTLNGQGSWSGTIDLADPRVKTAIGNNTSAYSLLTTTNTAVFIDNGGSLVYGGLLWTRSYDSSTRILTLGGSDFWSYLSSRLLANGASYTATDQMTIAANLVNLVQASSPGGNMHINVAYSTSGQSLSINFLPTQLASLESAFSTLSSQSGAAGFDYFVDVAYANGSNSTPVLTLTLSYPRRGRIASQDSQTFDVGSGAYSMGYTWPEDGSSAGNTVYGIGSGVGVNVANVPNLDPLRSIQTAGNLIYPTGPYPVLEQTVNRSDITTQSILDGVTTSTLYAIANPVTLPKVKFRLDMPTPQFGSYLIGDDARFRFAPDEFLISGLEVYYRIVSWTVDLPDHGVGSVELSLQPPPYIP